MKKNDRLFLLICMIIIIGLIISSYVKMYIDGSNKILKTKAYDYKNQLTYCYDVLNSYITDNNLSQGSLDTYFLEAIKGQGKYARMLGKTPFSNYSPVFIRDDIAAWHEKSDTNIVAYCQKTLPVNDVPFIKPSNRDLCGLIIAINSKGNIILLEKYPDWKSVDSKKFIKDSDK